MLHVFSLVCFLIYGVNRRQVLIAKPAKCGLNNEVIRAGGCGPELWSLTLQFVVGAPGTCESWL